MKLSAILAALPLAACVNTSGNTNTACQALSAPGTATPSPAWSGTVFTIVMENKSRGDIFGNASAPFINQLAKDHAVAMGYRDPFVHPSEANYLWMVAGQNFGVLDDDDPAQHSIDAKAHLADQLENAGLTWKSYQESMGPGCGINSSGRYAAKHNPFVFFSDVNGWDGKTFQPSKRCTDHIVDFSQLDADLASGQVPKYAFITPNLDHDMHDGSIAQGDAWVKTTVTKIMASDAYKHGGVIFLVWDEGGGTFGPGDDPPFIAISPNAKAGYVSSAEYDTTSFLLTVQRILGIDELPCAPDDIGSAKSMDDLFTVPLKTHS